MPLAPNTLPARAFQQSTRTSRLLFHWRASDFSLTPVTGEVPTFARATAGGLVLDSRGCFRDVAQAQPRWDMSGYNAATGLWETPTLLLEQQGTNLVPYNEALTAANGWTIDAGLAVTANYSRLGRLGLSRVTGAALGSLYRAVTLTGDGVKAVSFVVQWDGVAGTSLHGFYDLPATAFRSLVTVTWAADGTATAVASTGTLLRFLALADHAYWILARSTAVTAANNHQVYPVFSGGTVTSIRVGGVQVENAISSSSIILTPAGGMVTRNADALSYSFLAPPRAMTVYADLVDRGTSFSGGGYFDVGDYSGAGTSLMVFDVGGEATVDVVGGGAEVSGGGVVAAIYGNRMELRTVLLATGSAYNGVSVNAGPETVGATTTAVALDSTFRTAVLKVNQYGAAGRGSASFRALKIAAGIKTMDEMRSAF
jgi:hypothetical protein